jgi:hypothetical protein
LGEPCPLFLQFNQTIMHEAKMKLGLLGAGGKLYIKGGFLSYMHPYGRSFKVPIKDIDTVAVDTIGWGKGKLKIIGKGATLAQEEMPITWANRCQEWILENMNA